MFRSTALKTLSISTASAFLLSATSVVAMDNSPNKTVDTRATVTVHVSGFSEQTGAIMVALTDEAGYEGGQPVRGTRASVDDDSLTLTFENLPTGSYAIRMFHDVDGNGEMNTNPFGIPTEPFAFSNNAQAVMGPPSWTETKFDLGEEGAVQSISF